MRLPRGLGRFVWAAVFTVAIPLAQAQDATSDVSDPSVVSAGLLPTCRSPEQGQLACHQSCMINGYPSCDYCSTVCSPQSPPVCRPPEQGQLSCQQSCMINKYPSCDYCSTPCSASSLL